MLSCLRIFLCPLATRGLKRMPTRFTWDHFDDQLVIALARQLGTVTDGAEARSFLARNAAVPSDDFVGQYKDVLAREWIALDSRIGRHIYRQLRDLNLGPGGVAPRSAEECAAFVLKCRNTKNLRHILCKVLQAQGRPSTKQGALQDGHYQSHFDLIEPAKQPEFNRAPYPHQEDAWAELDESYGRFEKGIGGLLVMPTGSGKTFCSVSTVVAQTGVSQK